MRRQRHYVALNEARKPMPEEFLAIALLEQVAIDIRKGVGTKNTGLLRIQGEAIAWITSQDRRWPYSFLNVCDYLGLSPDAFREEWLRVAGYTTSSEAIPVANAA